jgi:hypothetical protein
MHKVLMEFLVTEDANNVDEVVEDDDYAATDSAEEDETGEDDESEGDILESDEDKGP